jgi:magnesium chelatase subunit D
MLDRVRVRERDLWVAAEVAAAAGVDGHRAELALLKAAQAHAALQGRTTLAAEDLALGARLALPHRLRRGPFEAAVLEPGQLEALVSQAMDAAPSAGDAQSGEDGVAPAGEPAGDGPPPTDSPTTDGSARPQPGEATTDGGGTTRPVASGEEFVVRPLDTNLERMSRQAAGRRTLSETRTRRGRYIRARIVEERARDVAFDATLRAAALRQAPLVPPATLTITPRDLHDKVRVRKAGNLILFLVDASWSMATAERLAAAKGAVLSLLVDAYQRRDRVALAVFRRRGTEVVLPFTTSVQQARRRLADIPVGGKTPLSHALWTADGLFRVARRKDPEALRLLILLTDGAGNISLTGRAPAEEAWALADQLRRRDVRSVVIDLYDPLLRDPSSPARQLALALGGEHLTVPSLQAGAVAEAVRERLVVGRS